MESYIQISKLNDFLFCPKSLYFHSIYEGFNEKTYHATPQTVGKIKHENIDKGEYSSAKRFLQGLEVYSDKYGLCGKIDVYDVEKCSLIERKYKVKQVFQGYVYQLYAQMFCLQEMGYEVKSLFIHSLSDNKRYKVDLPVKVDVKVFEGFLKEVKDFKICSYKGKQNRNKCENCIYKSLCC